MAEFMNRILDLLFAPIVLALLIRHQPGTAWGNVKQIWKNGRAK